MRSRGRLAVFIMCVSIGAQALAAPEPTGLHPRLLLTPALRSRLRELAPQPGAVAEAISECGRRSRATGKDARDHYMGLDWARNVGACLIAWAATGADAHAVGAMRYFVALLDDLEQVGDGRGGDASARRDRGFAMRAVGPYAALAYDWLHDHKLMTDAVKARARQRFAAWTTWYEQSGYRPHAPGTNYHAGYLVAATLIAIAQGGEAGTNGAHLWQRVANELWGRDMRRALGPGGILAGGDWSEGWQYGPLAVASYALAAQAMSGAGVPIDGLQTWADALLVRHVAAQNPSGNVFVAGDTGVATPYLPPHPHTLAAVAIAGSEQSAAWALDELGRLAPRDSRDDARFVLALAQARRVPPTTVPRAQWSTWYLPAGSHNLYARTSWRPDAIWFVAQCAPTLDVDHAPANAGNLVLSRGRDDLIVDPSPYGSLSTLTGNAPTVTSAQLPDNYRPGQGYWSKQTRWHFAAQFAGGAVAARCDYADAFAFQTRRSDISRALRDFALVPWRGGTDATLVVFDEARPTDATGNLYTRFRVPAPLALAGSTSTGQIGTSALRIDTAATSGGTPSIVASTLKDCFGAGTLRGNCNAARLTVNEHRLTVPGPTPFVAHIIDAGVPAQRRALAIKGGTGWWLSDGTTHAAVVRGDGSDTLSYRISAADALHIIVGAPSVDGLGSVTVSRAGTDCEVTLRRAGTLDVQPAAFHVTAACEMSPRASLPQMPSSVTAGATNAHDVPPRQPSQTGGPAPTSDVTPTLPTAAPSSPRPGCCGAQATPTAAWPSIILFAALRRRRAARSSVR